MTQCYFTKLFCLHGTGNVVNFYSSIGIATRLWAGRSGF